MLHPDETPVPRFPALAFPREFEGVVGLIHCAFDRFGKRGSHSIEAEDLAGFCDAAVAVQVRFGTGDVDRHEGPEGLRQCAEGQFFVDPVWSFKIVIEQEFQLFPISVFRGFKQMPLVEPDLAFRLP